MRLAITILSLLLMLVVGLQSCAASVGGSLSSNQATSSAAAVGMLVAFLFLIGGAFAIAYPLVSLVSFVLAGLFALVGGTSSVSDFKDLQVWGFVALILAILSYFGVREKRRRAAVEHQRVR